MFPDSPASKLLNKFFILKSDLRPHVLYWLFKIQIQIFSNAYSRGKMDIFHIVKLPTVYSTYLLTGYSRLVS